MFCPVCWKEYPKGFIKCDACNADLSEGKPQGHEHQHDADPAKNKPKPSEGKPGKK